MALLDDLKSDVKDIFASAWTTRDGVVVPEAESVGLKNEAVKLEEAVVLYADLAESTKMVDEQSEFFAAEVYKTFLHCASKVVKDMDGTITAFDGDRIMAVFLGDRKRTNAATAGLKIKYAVREIINPALKAQYPHQTYTLKHAVGIDASSQFVARTGVRGSNDLVWVGHAANYAAKLATLREEYNATWITAAVYDQLNDSAKFGGDPKENMWKSRTWTQLPGVQLYCSSWHWKV